MDNQPEERTTAELFSEYANLLWRWSWLLVLLACLAGGVAYYVSSQETPTYQSSTLVMINAAPSYLADTSLSYYISQQLVTTYAKVMTTQPILDEVKQRMGIDKLTANISVQPIQNTTLMTIVVQDTDPNRAAEIANTLVAVFAAQLEEDQTARYADAKTSYENQMTLVNQQIELSTNDLLDASLKVQETQDALDLINQKITNTIRYSGPTAVSAEDQNQQVQLQSTLLQYQLQQTQVQSSLSQYQTTYNSLMQSYNGLKLAEAQSTSAIIQKEPAVPRSSPIQPQPMRSALLAAVVGLVLAGVVIFLIEFLDNSIRDPQEITRKWGVPVLGIISQHESDGHSLITIKQPRAPVSEAFRALRTNLEFASVDTLLKTIVVTSSSPKDGKTTIASNLACVFAQNNRSVVVVDADLRRPHVHRLFQLVNRIGLTNRLIQPEESWGGSLQNTEVTGLKVITSGSLPPDPSELLSSIKMQEVLSSLQEQFDCIIIDTPPVLVVTDAVTLAPRVDGVIIVVKPSITKRGELHHVIEQMKQVKARILGVVINGINVNRSQYYNYRRYYSSYSYKYHKGYYSTDDKTEENIKEEKKKLLL